ncbi:MAG TPA: S8 family serine peptidase [Solirubrobacteraceae bacterium]|nr:S8 family serine peptidase [Solirubrobacteraceae bacterium]
MPDEPTPPRPSSAGAPSGRRAAALGLALALVATAVVVWALAAGGGGEPAASRGDGAPYDGRSPREPSAAGTRVIVRLPRPSLGAAGVRDPVAQRTYEESLRDEAAALRSALAARGVRLSDVRTYTRVFNGFAATVRTADLAELPSLGVRAHPVRRFYPATAEPARVPGLRAPAAAPPLGGTPVAVLDTGVDAEHPLLDGALDPGYDAVADDDDPARPARSRSETSGTALAGVLVAAGERVLPIRVAGAQATGRGAGSEDVAVSDQLLAGLEHAVDPDGDGATDDHVAVALVGVNAPFAGFEDTPEAEAIRSALELGTLVVAPAGGEGAAAGTGGVVGSPASAPAALAAAALAAPDAVARVDLTVGDAGAPGALLLAGAPPRAAGLRTAGPVEDEDPDALGRRVRDRLAVVRAGNDPGARAAAAAAAGARAVLLAEPRADRPLPSLPAGRVAVPVLGVTGAAAAEVLEEDAGAAVGLGPAVAGAVRASGPAAPAGDAGLSPFSSRGPTAAGSAKPDVAAPGAARTALAGGGGAVAAGTAVAAAHVALAAAQLVRERPSATPQELRRALAGGAEPLARLPARGAGAGLVRVPAAEQPVVARTIPPGRGDPCPDGGACARITLRNQGTEAARLGLDVVGDPGTEATSAAAELTVPPGGAREAEVDVGAAPASGLATGRLLAGPALSVPFAVPAAPPPPPPLGPLRLERDGGAVAGVSFPLGAFDRGDPLGGGTTVQLTERLELTLVRDGESRAVRRLTPPGGARELLPARYAYTLPAGTLEGLPRGRYAFRAVAGGPRGGRRAITTSEAFPAR